MRHKCEWTICSVCVCGLNYGIGRIVGENWLLENDYWWYSVIKNGCVWLKVISQLPTEIERERETVTFGLHSCVDSDAGTQSICERAVAITYYSR